MGQIMMSRRVCVVQSAPRTRRGGSTSLARGGGDASPTNRTMGQIMMSRRVCVVQSAPLFSFQH